MEEEDEYIEYIEYMIQQLSMMKECSLRYRSRIMGIAYVGG